MSSIVDRWHCGILGSHMKISVISNLPRVAIVGTKWPTVGHKSLSSIGAGFYI